MQSHGTPTKHDSPVTLLPLFKSPYFEKKSKIESMDSAYFKNCEELSIYLFNQIMKTGDHTLLLINPTNEQKESPEILEKLSEVWRDIYDEYCKLAEDNESLMYFALWDEVIYLETRYHVALSLLEQLEKRYDSPEAIDAYITELSKWEYFINRRKPLRDEVDKMYRFLKASTNKIRLKQDELKAYQKKEEPMTLTEQILKIELALGKNEINPKKTSVAKFIYMIKEIEKRNEMYKKRLKK